MPKKSSSNSATATDSSKVRGLIKIFDVKHKKIHPSPSVKRSTRIGLSKWKSDDRMNLLPPTLSLSNSLSLNSLNKERKEQHRVLDPGQSNQQRYCSQLSLPASLASEASDCASIKTTFTSISTDISSKRRAEIDHSVDVSGMKPPVNPRHRKHSLGNTAKCLDQLPYQNLSESSMDSKLGMKKGDEGQDKRKPQMRRRSRTLETPWRFHDQSTSFERDYYEQNGIKPRYVSNLRTTLSLRNVSDERFPSHKIGDASVLDDACSVASVKRGKAGKKKSMELSLARTYSDISLSPQTSKSKKKMKDAQTSSSSLQLMQETSQERPVAVVQGSPRNPNKLSAQILSKTSRSWIGRS